MDSVSIAAKRGGATGPDPTARGRPGTKRHIVTDRECIPLTVLLSGAMSMTAGCLSRSWMRCLPSGRRMDDRAAVPESFTLTRPMTIDAAGRHAPVAGSGTGSPEKASEAALTPESINGSWSAPSHGYPVSDASLSATKERPISTSHSHCSHAHSPGSEPSEHGFERRSKRSDCFRPSNRHLARKIRFPTVAAAPRKHQPSVDQANSSQSVIISFHASDTFTNQTQRVAAQEELW